MQVGEWQVTIDDISRRHKLLYEFKISEIGPVIEVYEVSELLQGEVSVLQAALTQRTVETRHDVIVTDLSATEANYARNALCKALYSRLFTWLVNKINDTIRAKRMGKRKCIGMLDIYGFEVLEDKISRFSQSACAQLCFIPVKAMQGNKMRKQIALTVFRSATSSDGNRPKKPFDDHVK
ncbi:Unconventional myosin-Ib [Araneus ventricosus]|uniref:Unconventional myosin-Ib n=1 Tax=Araneus ventricosus TaxID=182803 RepID=A0A4Y2SME9_ARAVE|nr:Unconventional myosin-Ib [Araneus ventricosus]GBN89497.1 Unconventional myosin-Ib [Araneus ventricosus]